MASQVSRGERLRRAARACWKTLVGALAASLACALIGDGCKAYLRHRLASADPRAELPNYPDRAFSRQLYRELAESQRFGLTPTEYWSRDEFHGRTTTIVRDGLIGRRVHREVPAGPRPRTIHFFGSSSTWGIGVDDDHTIPADFAREHPEYHAVNHGEIGFTSRQNLDRLINLVNQGARLDTVVFYDGATDVVMLCDPSIDINGTLMQPQLAQPPFAPSTAPLLRGLAEPLLGAAHLVSAIAAGRPHRGSRCDDPAYAARVADTLINDWSIAHALAAGSGARFLAVLQPVSFVGHPRTDQLARLPATFAGGLILGMDPVLGRMFARVYPLLEQRIRERNEPWMRSMTDAYDGREYIYVDYSHVDAAGNAIVARRIGEALDALP